MATSLYKKGIVLSIIVLFVGASVPPNILTTTVKADDDIIFSENFDSYSSVSNPAFQSVWTKSSVWGGGTIALVPHGGGDALSISHTNHQSIEVTTVNSYSRNRVVECEVNNIDYGQSGHGLEWYSGTLTGYISDDEVTGVGMFYHPNTQSFKIAHWLQNTHPYGTNNYQGSNIIIPKNQWYKMKIEIDDTTFSCYYDVGNGYQHICSLAHTMPNENGKIVLGQQGFDAAESLFDNVIVYGSGNQPPTQGLVGYWNFDEGTGNTAGDSSGNGNDGTIHGASWTNGVSGGALDFDGINDYVDVSSFDPSSYGKGTISTWVKLNDLSPSTIFGFYRNDANRGVFSYQGDIPDPGTTNPNTFTYGLRKNNVWHTDAYSNIYTTTGTWAHVVVTFDGTTARLYHNGILNSHTESGDIWWDDLGGSLTEQFIGRYRASFGEYISYFSGLIDEVRIYNRALSNSEIQYLYNSIVEDQGVYQISQDSITWDITPIYRSESPLDFYDYGYNDIGCGNTPFMEYYKSKIYFYKDTSNDDLSLIIHHAKCGGTDDWKRVDFDFENIPDGSYVSVTDDDSRHIWDPPRENELDITLEPEGHWKYNTGSDGGVLGNLPIDESWSMTINPNFISGINEWYYQEENNMIQLDMIKPITITYNPGDGGGDQLVADAGGPYNGDIGKEIEFTGSAYGGTAPYTYWWDLDGDGNCEVKGQTVYKSWDSIGTYSISLYAYDNVGVLFEDTALVIIDNQPTVEGLVGYWKFNHWDGYQVPDVSEYKNDGSIWGGFPDYVDGAIGSGLKFDDLNKYVNMNYGPSLIFDDTNEFTLSLCYKSNSISSFNAVLIQKYFAWKGYKLEINNNGNVEFSIGVGGNTEYTLISNKQLDTDWHKITVVWDGSMQYIYIDGIIDNSMYRGQVTVQDWQGMELHFGPFNGIIDEVRFYERALDEYEINKIPSLTITDSPYDYEVVSGTITISGIASDPDGDVFLSVVRIYDDTEDTLLGVANGLTSWSYDWDTTQIDDGYYKIKVVSSDAVDYSNPEYVNVFVSNNGISLPKAEPMEACEVLAKAKLKGRIIDRGGDVFYNCLYNFRYKKQGTPDWEYPQSYWYGYLSDEDFDKITDYLEPDTMYEFQVGAGNSITYPIGVWNEEDIILFNTPLIFWDDSTGHEYNYHIDGKIGGTIIPVGMDMNKIGHSNINGKNINLDIGPYWYCSLLDHYSWADLGSLYTPEEDVNVKVTMSLSYSGHLECSQILGYGATCDATIICNAGTGLDTQEYEEHGDDDGNNPSGVKEWTSDTISLNKNAQYLFYVYAILDTMNYCVEYCIPYVGCGEISTSTSGDLKVNVDYIKIDRVGGTISNDLTVTLECPADISVIDPFNRITNKTLNEIPGSSYIETDLNSDGELDDQIIIPEILDGEYSIIVKAEPHAVPDDTYSLYLHYQNNEYCLADHKYISEIPFEPYIFISAKPTAPLQPSGPEYGSILNEYIYKTISYHPNDYQISYLWDWGDGTQSSWLGPFESGAIIEGSHIWNEEGNYNIKVKAKCENCPISGWSSNNAIIIFDDNYPPITNKTVTFPKYGLNDQYVDLSTEFNLNSTDNISGVFETYYRIWYNNIWHPPSGTGFSINNNYFKYRNNFTLFGEGKHYIEYYSVDNVGNVEEVHNQTHYVDDSAPEINLDDPIILWPPNHKYHTMELSDFIIDVFDECDDSIDTDDVIIINVSSDEPENGNGDGNTLDDIIIIDNQTAKLRSERKGNGNGRVYTINFKVSDWLENTAYGSFQVWVPKSKKSVAIDDGPDAGYTVYYP